MDRRDRRRREGVALLFPGTPLGTPSRLYLLVGLAGLAGCDRFSDRAEEPTPLLNLQVAAAFDPLEAPLVVRAQQEGGVTGATGRVLDASGAVMAEGELPLEWDGRLAGGAWATPGVFTVEISAAGLEDSGSVALVRAAIAEAYAEDDGGASARRVPLYWHKAKSLQDPGLPFSAVAAVDDADGAVDLPALGAALEGPEDGRAEPLAYTLESRPILTLVPGTSTQLAGSGLENAEIGLRIEGWSVIAGEPLRAGQAVVLQKDEALSELVGVQEEPLELRFVAIDEEGREAEIGVQSLPVRFFALADEPMDGAEDLDHPWVAVVDPALRGIEGTAPEAVADALVAWIFGESGLSYDTRYGASAYSMYRGEDWTRPHFMLSAFLERRFGDTVNCSDCAAILMAYAAMLGVQLQQGIILENFGLNYIQAIGGDEFTRCPFGSNGCGFSYHAVTTDADVGRVWDATLALDGDTSPVSAPHEELLVQGVEADEYLWRLVRTGDASYNHPATQTIQ